MNQAERQTRSFLIGLLRRRGIHPRTDLGQNFLIDLNLVQYIVQQAEIGPEDVILEIGAGTGGMTTLLARNAAAVVSVEYDPNMFQLAGDRVAEFDNVTLLHCDALRNKNHFSPQVIGEVEQKLAEGSPRRLKLVSNLPYNIATPVVSNLVASELPWQRMIVTIQLELAQRMTAAPRTSDYSALSVWMQSQCRVLLRKELKPAVFWPRPKVHSAIVRIQPDPARRSQIANRSFFHDFVRRLFQQRRKLLRSVLVGMYRKQLGKPAVDALLQSMELAADCRAEALDPEALVLLSNRFNDAILRNQTMPAT